MAFRWFLGLVVLAGLCSCVSTKIRLPSSARQVNKNENMQQLLLLAAQNNILFYIPEATTREVEKTEINQKCREIEEAKRAPSLSWHLLKTRIPLATPKRNGNRKFLEFRRKTLKNRSNFVTFYLKPEFPNGKESAEFRLYS